MFTRFIVPTDLSSASTAVVSCLGGLKSFGEIARLVRERNVQLVVLGTQGRGFVGECVLGSVSQSMARASCAPVLLIPSRQ